MASASADPTGKVPLVGQIHMGWNAMEHKAEDRYQDDPYYKELLKRANNGAKQAEEWVAGRVEESSYGHSVAAHKDFLTLELRSSVFPDFYVKLFLSGELMRILAKKSSILDGAHVPILPEAIEGRMSARNYPITGSLNFDGFFLFREDIPADCSTPSYVHFRLPVEEWNTVVGCV